MEEQSLLIIIWVVITAGTSYTIYRRFSKVRQEVRPSENNLTSHTNTEGSSALTHGETNQTQPSPVIETPIDPSETVCHTCGTVNGREYWFCAVCVSPLHTL